MKGWSSELAEAPREGDVLVGREWLVAEEDHLVVVERLPDVGDDLVGQRLA